VTQNEQSLQKPTQFVRRRRSVFNPSNDLENKCLQPSASLEIKRKPHKLDRSRRHMSGNPTYQASRISWALNGPILSILNELSQVETRTR
jgi:hypothetical protein